jgi:hypothetical protein
VAVEQQHWASEGTSALDPQRYPVADLWQRRHADDACRLRWSSLFMFEPGWFPMDRPPGRLFGGGGTAGGMFMGADVRPIGGPTGILEGKVP